VIHKSHEIHCNCRSEVGFALPDMIFIACFLGLLTTVAVPAFKRYLERAKVTDVLFRLQKIADGAAAYYQESDRLVRVEEDSSGKKRFPESTPVTPARRCCVYGTEGKCEGTNWDTPSWRALGFAIEEPHRFRFQFISSGLGGEAAFTVRAHADLDCDGLESTFERVGYATKEQKVKVPGAVHTVRMTE